MKKRIIMYVNKLIEKTLDKCHFFLSNLQQRYFLEKNFQKGYLSKDHPYALRSNWAFTLFMITETTIFMVSSLVFFILRSNDINIKLQNVNFFGSYLIIVICKIINFSIQINVVYWPYKLLKHLYFRKSSIVLTRKKDQIKELLSNGIFEVVSKKKNSIKFPLIKMEHVSELNDFQAGEIKVSVGIISGPLSEKLKTQSFFESLQNLFPGKEIIADKISDNHRFHEYFLANKLKASRLKIKKLEDIHVTSRSIEIMQGVSWHFDNDQTTNGLIVAPIGSGKTRSSEFILVAFAKILGKKAKSNIYCLDPKNDRNLRFYKQLIGDHYCQSPDEILVALKNIVEINEKRKLAKPSSLSPIFVYLDELALLASLQYTDKNGSKLVNQYLLDLLRQSRSQKIFFLIAIQDPRRDNLSTEMLDQMGFRVILQADKKFESDLLKRVFNNYTNLNLNFYQQSEGLAILKGFRHSHPFDISFPFMDERSHDQQFKWEMPKDVPSHYFDLFNQAMKQPGLYTEYPFNI